MLTSQLPCDSQLTSRPSLHGWHHSSHTYDTHT